MNKFKNGSAALIIVLLCGCSSIPKSRNMVYADRISRKFNKALVNEVGMECTTRGVQLKTHKSSEIGIAAFDTALQESLIAQGLFSENGRFKLQVHILKILQPPSNSETKVTTHMQYTLVDSTSDKTVYQETIIAEHITYVTDALIIQRRRRLAIEGSGKRSIAQFIHQLSRL